MSNVEIHGVEPSTIDWDFKSTNYIRPKDLMNSYVGERNDVDTVAPVNCGSITGEEEKRNDIVDKYSLYF